MTAILQDAAQGALDKLFAAAYAARENAYAPYSHFAVGAAVRTPGGAVFSGANVENAAYPDGCCAETGAIAAMVAAGGREIAEVLVVADCGRESGRAAPAASALPNSPPKTPWSIAQDRRACARASNLPRFCREAFDRGTLESKFSFKSV